MAKQTKRDQEMQSLASAVVGLQEAIKSINASIKETAREAAAVTDDAAAVFTSQTKAAESLAGKLQGYSKEQLKLKGESSKLDKDLVKASNERAKLQSKITFFEQKLATSRGKEAKVLQKLIGQYNDKVKLLDESVEHAEDLKKILEDIDKDVKFFDDIAELVNDVPVLSKVFKEFGNAAKESRAAGGGKKGFLAGLTQLAKAGGKAAGLLAIGTIVKGFKLVNEQTTELSRGLNISRESALALRNSLNTTGRFTIAQMMEGIKAVNEELGTSGTISAETAEKMALMTQRLGLSGQEAAKLANLSAASGKSLDEFSDTLTGTVLAQNYITKSAVDYKQVLKDVAVAGAAIQLSSEALPGGIAKAAFNARKFGLTLSQVNDIAGGLLNFEESIGAELEAELLTGKELNFEKARMYALTNDLAGVSSELAKQGITAAKFAGMNRIAQEAIAKSMGMSRDDLADMLTKQEAMKNLDKTLTDERFKSLSLAQQTAILEGKGLDRAEALAKLGKDELDYQKENMSAAEAIETAMTKMQETVGGLGDPLNTIASAMKSVADYAKIALGALTALGLLSFGNVFKLGKVFNKLTGKGSLKSTTKSAVKGNIVKDARLPSGFRDAATGRAVSKTAGEAAMKTGSKSLAKTGSKLGLKTVLKRIPILGSLVGVGYAVDRAIKGDWAGAAMEAGSAGLGLLDLVVPGLGTGLSLAADAGIAARDLANAGTITPTAKPIAGETPMATGGIVSRPTRALVGEAGAEAVVPLNQFYKKMDEMIAAIREGGDVFIDGNKAGMALNLGAYRSSTA